MSSASTTLFFVDLIQKTLDQVPVVGASVFRSIAAPVWASFQPYLLYAISVLFLLLIIASVKAMLGQTGALGSLLYHIFYFGVLAVIIWIEGWEVVFNGYFDLICFVVYLVCYWVVGLILQKFRG